MKPREAARLLYENGMSQAEIAERTGSSQGNISKIISTKKKNRHHKVMWELGQELIRLAEKKYGSETP